ncbi:MAG: hypothetical protein HZA67_08980 [Rhodospirillales bacterium]|nr:hypothetical protein [Rhodospirillales bacterium]
MAGMLMIAGLADTIPISSTGQHDAIMRKADNEEPAAAVKQGTTVPEPGAELKRPCIALCFMLSPAAGAL